MSNVEGASIVDSVRARKKCGFVNRGPYTLDGFCRSCNRESGVLYKEGIRAIIWSKLNKDHECKQCAGGW